MDWALIFKILKLAAIVAVGCYLIANWRPRRNIEEDDGGGS